MNTPRPKNPALPTFSGVLEDIERNSSSFREEDHIQAIVASSKDDESNSIRRMRILLLILVGAVAAGLFLFIGISAANNDQEEEFARTYSEVARAIDMAVNDYVVAASYIQEASRWHNTTREEFQMLYLNMKSSGLVAPMISYNPKVSHVERMHLEMSSREYFEAEYPDFAYSGIQGLESSSGAGEADSVQYRSEQPYYYPSHLTEPVYGNEDFVDFDMYSVPAIRTHIERATETWEPTLTPRVGNDHSDYSVFLLHPGILTLESHEARGQNSAHNYMRGLQGQASKTEQPVEQRKAISFTAIQIQLTDLMSHLAHLPPHDPIHVYIFCESSKSFMGGVKVSPVDDQINYLRESTLEFQSKISQDELLDKFDGLKMRKHVFIPLPEDTEEWTMFVFADEGSYHSDTTFVVTAAVLLFVLCLVLGFFIYGNIQRTQKLSQLQAIAQQEKAMLVVQNAGKAAKRERDLNDFIAHEVRNPLAAAMSACSFVTSEVLDEQQPMVPPERYESVKEDFEIIDSSLHFINDLLRNMLDMQRAGSKQLKIDLSPTHVMNDILRPVDCMLHRRGANFKVVLECDDDLTIMTDSLRLKQIVLNLARNSVKFVDRGFIRIKATTVLDEDTNASKVRLCVEDSGPGIPPQKREQLFGKFQESLDSLHQGTGIGLSLCKQLTTLMGGKLWIDEDYDSGLFDCPGARFVVDLNTPPMVWDDALLDKYESSSSEDESTSMSTVEDRSDDDMKMESAMAITMDTSTTSNTTMDASARSATGASAKSIIDSSSRSVLDASTRPTGRPTKSTANQDNEPEITLPEELSVLFVDDDMVLRKLFSRSVRKVAPKWAIKEAGNGEAALGMTKTEDFDLIFMDQYMASVQKQLLGTETTRALRAQGITATICGLSANDVEKSFLEAGADSFLMKPFPCKPDALRKELVRIVNTDRTADRSIRTGPASVEAATGLSSVAVWTENV
jgi:signal transduction histidine kinase/CheY-like chemotaxis protein